MQQGYNERLFSGKGLRFKYHIWRFDWLKRQIKKYIDTDLNVIELGCFDGKTLDFLPKQPIRYVGLDADWEGGLSSAQDKYAGSSNLSFINSSDPADLQQFTDGQFNVGIAQETLEHIPPESLDSYLAQMARVIEGYLLVTVPNEKGIIFFIKRLAKLTLGMKGKNDYTAYEFFNATIGRMDKVERDDHKGFDHEKLRDQIEEHFDIVECQGGPLSWLPPSLNLTIGIVARTRPQ